MKKITALLLMFFLVLRLAGQEDIRFKVDELRRNSGKLEEKEKLRQLSKMYMDYQLHAYPEQGTYIGKPVDKTRWTDFSPDAIEQRKSDRSIFLKGIKSINRASLDEGDRLNYDLLKNSLELEKEGEVFPSELMPIDQISGYHQQIMQVVRLTSLKSEKDVADFLARLGNVPTLVDQLIGLMDEGLKRGITPPKITLSGVPEQIQNLIEGDVANSPFLSNLNDYLEKGDLQRKETISEDARRIVSKTVNPSLRRLKSYLENTYIPGARESYALKALPNGENWYNYNIRVQTTTSLTFQQIHDIGLREVKRIRGQMDSLIRATGFNGSFEDFAQYLRTDKRFYYDSAQQLLDAYRVIAKKIDIRLPEFFGKLPRLTYGVLPIPSFDEKFQTTAYYMPGSPEAGRAGVFFANTYDLKSRPKWEMEALTFHEAVPGHHLQIALAQELSNVPEFRKYTSYTAFVEGWGLYSESLGGEMGFYADPYSKFGQLTYEMWRAIRLVVDTGIHGMGWSRQQAIAYFKANAAKTEHDITVEVDRYIAWPGQALAYKIGELKIKQLKAEAERRLGSKFDIRKFHDAVLENGALPLDVLEQKVREWMEAERK
ncbi:MAG TPA: DUF885 domain-containing protein [Chryseosolibacter sp.]